MGEVFRFECRYQLRSPLFLSMAALFFLLAFAAMASEDVSVGAVSSSVNFNGTYSIIQTQYVFSIILMIAGVAFVAGAITRDHDTGTAELLFASGVSERSYFFGRFAGGALFCALVGCAALLGTLIGSFMPWLDPERVGPLLLGAYGYSLFVVVLPNALIVSALFFVVAAMTRSMLWAYVAALGFLVLYVVLSAVADPETQKQYAYLDPFGITPFSEAVRYWTAFERNTALPPISGSLLTGRLFWVGFSLLLLCLASLRFRFRVGEQGGGRRGRRQAKAEPQRATPVAVPLVRPTLGGSAWLAQFFAQLKMDVRGILRSTPFYVMLAFGIFNTVGGVFGTLELAYGTPRYPVTALLLDVIAGAFSLVLLLVIIYYSGELVHRERDARVKQIIDATPHPSGIVVAAKVLALWFVLLTMLAVVGLACIVIQLSQGYGELELGLYARGLFGVIAGDMLLFAVLSIVIQVLTPNKFIGMLWIMLVFIAFEFLGSFGFEHYLYSFGLPAAPYSDMNGYGHFVTPYLSFAGYWALWSLLLILGAHLLFVRGVDGGFAERLRGIRQRLNPPVLAFGGSLVLAIALAGGAIFYNTNVLNDYQTRDDREALDAGYEKTYGALRDAYTPQILELVMNVDLFPEARRLDSAGTATLENHSPEPMTALTFTLARPLEVDRLEFEGRPLKQIDVAQNLWRLKLEEPLAPGQGGVLRWAVRWENRGFVARGSTTRIVENGTFVNNTEIMPLPGYDGGRELQDNATRRDHDLPPVERLPKLEDARWHAVNFFGVSARTGFKARVSTAADQLAVAPGYLQRQWEEGDRRYFEYEMDREIWPFVSFSSARYAVEKQMINGQQLEVYYHPAHHWNVETMLRGSRDSLAYFSDVFSPYQHRQFRILEFPRYESFAQSFPNTIPYSESIGFLADLRDDKNVDFVYYVTAHEAAHQWWGHQLAPARVQGSAVLTESLAQYSALMVMERAYGEPMMRRFLKRELDRYLRGRGGEAIEELPLKRSENQGYIHYRKGSLVMYDVKQMLGEARVNAALKRLLTRFAGRGAPFPTTVHLIEELKREASAAEQQRIADLFEKITLYDLSIAEASVEARDQGFTVTVVVDAAKYYADGEGRETEAPLSETLKIGLFPERSDAQGEDDLPLPLLLESRQLNSGRQTLTFFVAQVPAWVGVDPYLYRVDRNPDDNLKRIEG